MRTENKYRENFCENFQFNVIKHTGIISLWILWFDGNSFGLLCHVKSCRFNIKWRLYPYLSPVFNRPPCSLDVRSSSFICPLLSLWIFNVDVEDSCRINYCMHVITLFTRSFDSRMSIYESIFIHANRYKWNPSIQMVIFIQSIHVIFSLIFHYCFAKFFITRNHNLLCFKIFSDSFIDIYSMLSIFQCAFTIWTWRYDSCKVVLNLIDKQKCVFFLK